MFENFQILCTGVAAVIDTVLLVALARRRNLPPLGLPILLLAGAVWLWHTGAFLHLLLVDLTSPLSSAVHWFSMSLMGIGLGLMPSAMLHIAILLRWPLRRAGIWQALVYLPLLAIIPGALGFHSDPEQAFLPLLEPLIFPYALWLVLVSLACGIQFFLIRTRVDPLQGRLFFPWLAVAFLMLAGTFSFVFLYALGAWPDWKDPLILAALLAPVPATLLFAYFIIRFNFLQLVLRRSMLYGAILIGIWLFHQLLVKNLTSTLEDRYQVDFGILEGLAIIGLILLIQPLRQRISEALQYLMGSRISGMRDGSRRLAVELSALAGRSPEEILHRFVESTRELVKTRYLAAWLSAPSGRLNCRSGGSHPIEENLPRRIQDELLNRKMPLAARGDSPAAIGDCLVEADASLAVAIRHLEISGLLLFGRRKRNREFSEEEINAILFLGELLGTTIRNSLLLIDRLAVERRAFQNEKLSLMGLLASSIAHEVKNPLSSIKTISTVLAEDLGPENEHADDLHLILGEVDRLSATTSRLLEFARPLKDSGGPSGAGEVLRRTLRFLRHLARQRDIRLEIRIEEGLPPVQAPEAALGEIFFNLLSNSLEAAGEGGRVEVSCIRSGDHVQVEVRDNGPGISPEDQDRLFEPFFTTKDEGTGLGLYITARRVRELGGEIRCDSARGEGTSFAVQLPLASVQAGNMEITDSFPKK